MKKQLLLRRSVSILFGVCVHIEGEHSILLQHSQASLNGSFHHHLSLVRADGNCIPQHVEGHPSPGSALTGEHSAWSKHSGAFAREIITQQNCSYQTHVKPIETEKVGM